MSGINTGLDHIRNILSDCQVTIRSGKASVECIIKTMNDIEDTIKHMNVMSVFMFESINRVLDCSKTQKGMKLIAKNETMCISDTLSLPITCMREIQSKIQIEFLPLDKNICSHIITDKLWFQENMLCLLSNAVKYSSDGVVTISISLMSKATLTSAIDIAPRLMTRNVSERNLEEIKLDDPIVSRKLENLRLSKLIKGYSSKRVDIEMGTSGTRKVIYNSSNDVSSICASAKTQLTSSVYASAKSYWASSKVNCNLDGSIISSSPSVMNTKTNTNNMMLLVEVQDTGIGISQEVMDELFSPFKQAQRLAGGTGLGLYSLAQRVEALNGTYGVRARSDGKRGSMFWFTIPYKPDEIMATETVTPRNDDVIAKNLEPFFENVAHLESNLSCQLSDFMSGKNNENLPPSQLHTISSVFKIVSTENDRKYHSFPIENKELVEEHLNILLVDDSYSILRLVGKMLRKNGHQVTEVINGAEALNRLDAVKNNREMKQFDVVIVDLHMPVMDGKYTAYITLYVYKCLLPLCIVYI